MIQEFYVHLQEVVAAVTQQLNDYKLGMAAETCYNEFWHWYCDECIENSKKGEISGEQMKSGLLTFVKLLHPFMPFITEELWGILGQANLLGEHDLLMVSNWPA